MLALMPATNPVVVNGLPLEGEGSSVVLREGDRIEIFEGDLQAEGGTAKVEQDEDAIRT